MTDRERLDFLQWLMTRKQYQNKARPQEPVNSDIHLVNGRCTLHVRDLFGNSECTSSDPDVREAIDRAARNIFSKRRPQ